MLKPKQDPKDTDNRFSYFFTVDKELWSAAKMMRIRDSRWGFKEQHFPPFEE